VSARARQDDQRLLRWLMRACVLLLAAGLLAFVVEGANRPLDPHLGPPTTTVPGDGTDG
jgi:hypothetical protein